MEAIRGLVEKRHMHRLTLTWIEKAIASSFYPERAKVNFERFLESLEETDHSLFDHLNKRNIPLIGVLFSGSQALSDMAIKNPRSIFWALGAGVLNSTRFKREMRRVVKASLKKERDNPKKALCRFHNWELMRIGWRDLLKWADTLETLEDLSRLADVCMEAALSVSENVMTQRFGRPIHPDGSPGRFFIIGMGKLGGRELNFSSDIDLIYMFDDPDGETEGGIGPNGMKRAKVSITEYYTKVALHMTSLASDIGPDGNVYRVDLGLRPEGSQGPVVCSLAAAELYYESWGQPWERQAMIKARFCAGSVSLGNEFTEMIRPFVYRKSLDFGALREIQQIKEKIDKHLKAGKDKYKNNVKLGKGGIREIEFVIQAYQIIYGGKMPWLDKTNSLKALHRIFERGLIGFEQYAALADALLFLRDLENRMQITYGRQVQILPLNEELHSLALKMGLTDAETLMREYERITSKVNDIFVEFFREEAEELEDTESEFFVDLESEEEAVARLREMGFADPKNARARLLHIRDGEPFSHPSTKSRRMFMRLLPKLLKVISNLPHKDRTVKSLDTFFTYRTQREGLYEILLEFPPAREVLLTVLAYAQNLTDILLNQPGVVEILGSGVAATRSRPLSSMPETADTYEKKIDWIRRERNSESIRIAIGYLMSHQNTTALMRQLSDLADSYIQESLKIIEEELGQKEGPRAAGEVKSRFTVIGLGKLGRMELNYGSDLDIMFIYSTEGSAAFDAEIYDYYTNVCRRLLNFIGGISQYGLAYKVDTRLRPEGEKGPIIIAAGSAREYYEKRGALWERMALCGARPVAGDMEFGQEFLESLAEFVYGSGYTEKDENEMARMKTKMESEKVRPGRKIPIKYGKGGITDIEFFAQKQKLAHGANHPHLRPFNTIEMLEALDREGFAKAEVTPLVEAYRFLRTVETHIRMETGRGSETLPYQPRMMAALEESLKAFAKIGKPLADAVTETMEKAHKALSELI